MKRINNEGFTIIEILVAINISFIAITLIIGFYLFASRFTGDLRNKLEAKNKIYNEVFLIEEMLEHSQDLNAVCAGSGCLIINNRKDSLMVTADQLKTNRGIVIKNISYCNLSIAADNYVKEITLPGNPENEIYGFRDRNITGIRINFTAGGSDYSIIYRAPLTSTFYFKNIGSTD